MKTISLILKFYNRRFELVEIEPDFNEVKEYLDTSNRAVKRVEQRKGITILS